MKKNFLSLKYIIFTLALIIGSFTLGSSASADTWTYNCGSGGAVLWVGYLTPGSSPYVYGGGSSFQAEGHIETLNCSVNQVSLSVKNNGGTEFPLIPSTTIGMNDWKPAGFINATQPFTTPSTPNMYPVTFTVGVDDNPSVTIGYVFAVGPHEHGSGQKVVYVPDPAAGIAGTLHPPLTVRVKVYGFHWPYYEHTTIPDPPNSLDAIFTIPAGTGSTTYPQVGTCTGGICSIGLEHSNYNAVSSVTGANVGTYIPGPYHVCKYDDQPGIGKYFSPAKWLYGAFSDEECGVHYPDAEVVR